MTTTPHLVRADASRVEQTCNPKRKAKNRPIFHGTLNQLQDLLLLTGDYGEWEEKPNGVWRYRSDDGGGLNWSSTRGTLWFDGPTKPQARLERVVKSVIEE